MGTAAKNMNWKVLLAVIAIIPSTLTAVLGYMKGARSTDAKKAEIELTDRRLKFAQSPNPNFKELQYPNYGISLMCPRSWTIEDGPARLAGGEFNLVQRYEDTKGSIGMNFRLRPVQPNYVSDLAAQVQNQADTLKAAFKEVEVVDASVSGLAGKVFVYENPTGKRRMKVKLYWIRVVPEVQLQILAATYTDASDKEEFWRDAEQVVSSTIIAFDSWQARAKVATK